MTRHRFLFQTEDAKHEKESGDKSPHSKNAWNNAMIRERQPSPRYSVLWLMSLLVLVWLAVAGPSAGQTAGPGGDASKKTAGAKATEPPARGGPVPTTNLFDMMREGGPLMWPLALCSVIGLAFVFERLVSLRRSRIIPKAFVTRFLAQVREGSLDRERALAVCEEYDCPISEIFAAAVRKWGRAGMEVEQAIMDAGERATNGLRKYIRIFTALAVIGPLLGLLGTAMGMIQAFNAVALSDAAGRQELLAKGISQALLNTAFGLVIAIPAQSFYFYLLSRVDRLIIEMDGFGQELVQLVSAEEIQYKEEGRAARAAKPKRASSKSASGEQEVER
jgi:biopolymer transport protein ExbB